MLNGLYALTDATLTPGSTLLTQATQAIAGGAKILQLRDKHQTDFELLELARALKTLCQQNNVLFIINDRIELAKKVNADGVHIGQYDLDFVTARQQLPEKIIGVSCYGNIKTALHYEQQGANYVAFGAFFASSTKPQAPVIEHTLLNEAKQVLSIPFCAIGGITVDNAPLLLQHGVDMLAVVSDLWLSPDITTRAQMFSALFAQRR